MPKIREVQDIPLETITISQGNVRKRELEKGIDELAQSIKDIGLQQPVVVFPIPGKKDKYELIIGQRRLMAFRKLRKEKIPALVLEKPMNRLDAIAYSFVENIHREELDYKDKMEVALYLLKDLKTVEAVAQKLGVSEPTVRNYLGYAAVPEPVKKMVEERKISRFTAIRLSRNISDPDKTVAIAKKIHEVPRSEQRRKIVEIATENPDLEPETVFKEAERAKLKRISLDLTPAAAEALQKASQKYEKEPEEIAMQVLVEYLKNEGFFATS